ncbi:MFS transporter [Acidisoma cellulosilytica]|uniref:MFS transporter n=1 Tax=Acidisoma cellulosilyticum TaxID=2802395 RepID=A0A963Z2B6_9PROT|nr:MFS transporter [Acidisoma cellulosilyticum]MCB8881470.1 MFS transporter [Acidisoma cellulosilyticum]
MESSACLGRLRVSRYAALSSVAFAALVDYLVYGAIVALGAYSPAGQAGDRQLGVLYGAYAFGLLVSTPLFGILGDRRGYRFPMLLGSGFGILAVLLLGAGPDFATMLLGRVLQGVAAAATWTAGFALLASHYQSDRVRMLGIAFMASTAGTVLGPVLSGALYEIGGYKSTFLVLGMLVLIDAVGRFLLLPSKVPPLSSGLSTLDLLMDRSVVVSAIAVAAAAAGWGILEPLLPHHLQRTSGPGPAVVGLLFTVASIVYGLFAPLVSFSTARFGLKPTIIGGLLGMAVTLPLLGVSLSLPMIGLVLCLVSIALAFLLNPTAAELGYAVERRGLACYGAVYAVYNIAYSIGMMGASTLVVLPASSVSFSQIMLCAGLILLLLIPLVLRTGPGTPAQKPDVRDLR